MRLFFALWPERDAAEELAAIARGAAAQFGGKATRQETIHLTLAFLGDLREEQLPALAAAAGSVRCAPFALEIDCLGYWERNRLLWAGMSAACADLGQLVDGLRQALSEADFEFGRPRVFFPHISLVRRLPEAREPLALPAIVPVSWRCSRFALVRSQTPESGAHYETLSAFPLNPG